jgi:hypothetical protein
VHPPISSESMFKPLEYPDLVVSGGAAVVEPAE